MLKNENKRDNLFILANVINVSEQEIQEILAIDRTFRVMLISAVAFRSYNLMKEYFISVLKSSWGMLLEYAMRNRTFRLKNSIWPTNDLEKCF